MFPCYKCYKPFSSNQRLEYHLNKKTPCVPDTYDCKFCRNMYTKDRNLNRHLATCPKNPNRSMKRYKCPKCSEEVNRKDSLLRHMSDHCQEYKFCTLKEISDDYNNSFIDNK